MGSDLDDLIEKKIIVKRAVLLAFLSSLLLACIFSGTAHAGTTAMVAYQNTTDLDRPPYRTWDGNQWSGGKWANSTNGGGTIRWVVLKSAPTRDEKILVTFDNASDTYIQLWNGTCWHNGTACNSVRGVATSAPNAAYRSIDVAYEQDSGDAVVVYMDSGVSTTIPRYDVWNGTSWLGESAVSNPGGGDIYWLRLEPDPTSDEMILVMQDSTNDIEAQVWDGGAWGNTNTLETSAPDATTPYFDIAYEQLSGRGIVAWSNNSNFPNYKTWDGSWGSEGYARNVGGTVDWVELAADPSTNNVSLGTADSASDLNVQIWDGANSYWGPVNETETALPFSTVRRPFDLAWERYTSKLMVAYSNSSVTGNSGRYRTWTPSSGWSHWSDLPSRIAANNWTQLRSDPYYNEMFVGRLNNTLDLTIQRWNGASWGDTTVVDHSASSATYECFMLAYDTFKAINATLNSPADGARLPQNGTFEVNATVTCNAAFCGNVSGTLRNGSTNMSSTAGRTPFYIINSEPNTKACALWQGQSCTLGWVVNATGTINSYHNLSVYFWSNRSGIVPYETSNASVQIVLPWLEVNLTRPLTGDKWAQNATYEVNATAIAHGPVSGVLALPRNGSTNMSDAVGNKPFYNLTAVNVSCGNMADGATCTVGWVVNATGPTNYYNISALFIPTNVYRNETANATIEIVPPFVELVSFSSPANGTRVLQNYTFQVNVSVISHGDTGNVQGIIQNSSYPEGGVITNMSNVTGRKPFYVLNSEPNPKPCSGNPMADQDTCDLGWVVNATGAAGYYNLRVLLESGRSIANGTNTSNVTVQIVLPYMNATLNSPASGLVNLDASFTVTATVTAVGDVGNVVGWPLNDLTNMSNVPGAEPVYIDGDRTKSCSGNPLTNGESCELTWTVYASGEGAHAIAVNFSSDRAGIVGETTGSATITIIVPNPAGAYYAPNIEVELTNLSKSCGTDTAGNSRCHHVKPPWPAETAGGTRVSYLNAGDHPATNRSPASFYPDFVHRHHGGTNWPHWNYLTVHHGGCPGTLGDDQYCPNITVPYYGTRYAGFMEQAGGGAGDVAIRRHKYETDYDYPHTTEPFYGNPGGANIEAYVMWTCSWADAYDSFNGCHGIREIGSQSATSDTPRTDAIPCTYCHNSSSLVVDHGTYNNNNCRNCHFSPAGAANTLSGNNPNATAPEYAGYCNQTCHTQITNVGLRNATYGHAGVDCRYCHGHAHNVSGLYSDDGSWNVTCGNSSSACHGTGASSPRNVGGVTHNLTAGASPTCDQCHVTNVGIGKAHNISIPGCGGCHNTTATGVKKTNMSVPNWMTYRNLTHGDEQRGSMGNISCALCHSTTTYHSSPTTNRDCRSANCHGDGGWFPIPQTHSNVECWECHNNASIVAMSFSGPKDLSTNIHASNSSWIIPFNISRNRNMFTNADCRQCHDNSTYIPQAGDCECCHNNTDMGDASAKLNIHSTSMSVSANRGDGVHGARCTECHYSYFACYPGAFVNETDLNNSVHKVTENAFYCTTCHVNTTGHLTSFVVNESYFKWCECCHVAYQGQNKTTGGTAKWAVNRHNLTGNVYKNYFYNDSYTLAQAASINLTVLNVTDCRACHDSTLITNARKYYNTTTRNCRACHPFPDFAKGGSPY